MSDELDPPGLGDKMKDALTSIGITKEFYCNVKEKFGLMPECDCDDRVQWLNNVSKWWRKHKRPLWSRPKRY